MSIHLLKCGRQWPRGTQAEPATTVMVQGDLPALHFGRIDVRLPSPATDAFILALAAHQVDIERRVTALQTLRFGGARWAVVLHK
ncbi:hypothetical protein D3C84_868830 [compost metagenome]